MRRLLMLGLVVLLALGGVPAAGSLGCLAWLDSAEARSSCCGDACTCGDVCPCGVERDPAPERPAAPAAVVSIGGERLATPPETTADLDVATAPRPARVDPGFALPTEPSGRRRLLLKGVLRT